LAVAFAYIHDYYFLSKIAECELTCQSKGRAMSLAKSGKKQKGRGQMRASKNLKKQKGRGVEDDPATTPDKNLTNPVDYRRHENRFLNRKMLIYNVISQIDDSSLFKKGNAVPYGEPLKTFELFHIMKNITQSFCPSEFVNPDWIEIVVELFYTLHKGNVFRYEEPLSHEQYDWIKDILLKCQTNLEPITLSAKKIQGDGEEDETENSLVCKDGGKVTRIILL